jgi:hypothetical protein
VNAGLCADGPAVHVDRDDAHAFGPLGGVGGVDRMCASATWTNCADVVLDVLHRDRFGHRPHHRLRGDRALGRNPAAGRGRPPPNKESPMTVTVLYPEDRQIPDLALEQEVFGPEVRIVRAASRVSPNSTRMTALRRMG